MVGLDPAHDLGNDPPAFFLLVEALQQKQPVSFLPGRDAGLWNTVRVLGNQRVGCIDDVSCRTVVCLQAEELAIRVVFLEIEDVLDLGPSE